MRRLVIAETKVILASCSYRLAQKSAHLPYSSKVRSYGQAALLPAAADLVCWTCRRGTGVARDVSQVTEVDWHRQAYDRCCSHLPTAGIKSPPINKALEAATSDGPKFFGPEAGPVANDAATDTSLVKPARALGPSRGAATRRRRRAA
jgi:hypothetical protein